METLQEFYKRKFDWMPDNIKNEIGHFNLFRLEPFVEGELTFKDGVPEKNNFNKYRMIRMSEAPKVIEVHFVKNEESPTGLGEPLFPPVFAGVANALYKATGKRFYTQPFANDMQPSGVRLENKL